MESVFFSVMGSESQMAPLLMLASNCLKRTLRIKYGKIEVKRVFHLGHQETIVLNAFKDG